MKKCISALLLLLVLSAAHAQNGWLPPRYFNGSTNVCDGTPYKLVFYDEFNGNQLNTPWLTFGTWNGHDSHVWPDSRKSGDNALFLDQNVVVSNGTVKLLIKNEHATWKCDTCGEHLRVTEDFTLGQIVTPYSKGFHNGRFEARIKFPNVKNSWCAFWLWYGDKVNEIDIAEQVGGTKNWPYIGAKAHPKVTYSTHAWGPQLANKPNPYNLPNDAEWTGQYPKQTWWNFFVGNNFKQTDWHTYACEWDPNTVRIFIDNNLQAQYDKYYKKQTIIVPPWNWSMSFNVNAGCVPTAGNWQIAYGFPHHDTSNSQLRLSTGMASGQYGDQNAGTSTLGQMEIDYVKAWQRHPHNGWSDLCDPHNITINGPDVICSTATYTASLPTSTGFWNGTSSNLTTLSSNATTINVQKTSAPGDEGFLYYYPNNPACPSNYNFQQWKRVFVGKADNASVVCTKVNNQATQKVYYGFHADPHYTALPNPIYNYNSPTTYEWDIYYGPNLSQHQHVWGQTVSTPWHSYTPNTQTTVQWQVKITNACGTVTKSGQQTYLLMKKVPNSGAEGESPLNAYFVADLPNDITPYHTAVLQRANQTNIPESEIAEEMSVVAQQTMAHILLEELEPYIVFDSSDIVNMNMMRKTNQPTDLAEKTVLYPNPANNLLNIELGNAFNLESPLTVRIYDMLGKLQHEHTYQHIAVVAMDISYLPIGTYNVMIQQDKHVEHQKLVKNE